jgi:hypothetical protein
MKPLNILCAFGLAACLAAGCETKTTTTGSVPGPGPSGTTTVKKLTVKGPTGQSIKQGDSNQVSISIVRDNFNDPVTIRLNDLPKGVVCVEDHVVVPAGDKSIKLTLKAAADAEIGEHDVKIDATAPGIDENVQTFKLNVKDNG